MPFMDMRPMHYDDWELRSFPLDASAAFVMGDPVAISTGGDLQIAADPTVIVAAAGFLGIAAQSGDTTGLLTGGTNGTLRYGGFGSFNPSSSIPGSSSAEECLVWVPKRPGAEVLAKLTTDGTTVAVPVQTDIGDPVGIEKITAGNWCFSNHATPEKLGRIVGVLDKNFNNISISGAAGVWIVTAVIVTQTMSGAVTSFAVPAAVTD